MTYFTEFCKFYWVEAEAYFPQENVYRVNVFRHTHPGEATEAATATELREADALVRTAPGPPSLDYVIEPSPEAPLRATFDAVVIEAARQQCIRDRSQKAHGGHSRAGSTKPLYSQDGG